MLCTTFGTEPSTRYLTNELADALAANGSRVLVVAMQWSIANPLPEQVVRYENGVEALFLAPRKFWLRWGLVQSLFKWTLSSFFMLNAVRKTFGAQPVDILFVNSPLIVSSALIRWAFRHYKCKGFAYLTDFFPFHQRASRQIPGGALLFIGRKVENSLVRLFSTIGCMSPLGATYLRKHYQLKPTQNVEIVPLWADIAALEILDRTTVRQKFALPQDKKIILFGGQISEGRGVQDVLSAADLAKGGHPDLVFLFVGNGRLRHLVETAAARPGSNVVLFQPVARSEYLELASACDVGIVATVADTGVPTFPSKTIDYLRARLPIAASVEVSTDYGEFLEANAVGRWVPAGHPDRFLSIIAQIAYDRELSAGMRRVAEQVLIKNFDVGNVVTKITRTADC